MLTKSPVTKVTTEVCHFVLADQDHGLRRREAINDLIRPLAIGEARDKDNDLDLFKAGRLAQFVSHWEEMGAPDFILRIIKGYRIPFLQKPPLRIPDLQNHRHRTVKSDEMSLIIQKMKQQGVLRVADLSPSFVSPLFLVPKRDGSSRPVFNLKLLNQYVLTDPFRLINMNRVPDFLQPQDFMCKVDLTQAYFNLQIARSHRRFLRLLYEGELLEMTCLPFGLCTAPKVFACLTNWIAQTLRANGVRVIVYLDDYLLANQDQETLGRHVDMLLRALEYLGFQINYTKSILVPQKIVTYLSIVWDPWQNQKYLPPETSASVAKKLDHVLKIGKISLKELQSLVGLLNFASFVVPRGRLNHRESLKFLNSLPEGQMMTKYSIPCQVKEEMHWWLRNRYLATRIHVPPPMHFLATDASDMAWGAQIDNHRISGIWDCVEKHLHCNQKEMLAIYKTLECHARHMAQSSVLIQSDNRTAVAYLRNEGGTKSQSLMNLARKIFQILDHHQIHLKIQYIPGKFNTQADCLSRLRGPAE